MTEASNHSARKFNINWFLLCTQLVRAMRGNHSQMELCKKLGFDYNQVSRWENGTKRIYWSDFVSLALACDVDVAWILNRYFAYSDDPVKATLLVKLILPYDFQKEEARLFIDISASQFSRLLNEQAEFSLEQIMQIIAMRYDVFYMLQVFENFHKDTELEEAKRLRTSFDAEVALIEEYPVVHALLRSVELSFLTKNSPRIKMGGSAPNWGSRLRKSDSC